MASFEDYLEPLNQCFNDKIGKKCHEINPYSNVFVKYGKNPATGNKYKDKIKEAGGAGDVTYDTCSRRMSRGVLSCSRWIF